MLSGCGAVGSALDWGSRGREFKSRHSDHPVDIKKIFAQKTALWRGFLMPESLDFESAKTWMKVSEK